MSEYHYDRSVKDEARIINALIIEPESREVIFERLNADHFADPVGKTIFEGFASCWRRNIPLDTDGTVMQLIKPGDYNTDQFINQGIPGNYGAAWRDSLEVVDRFELCRQVLNAARLAQEVAQEADKTRADLLEELRGLWVPTLEATVSAQTQSLSVIIDEEASEHQEFRAGTKQAVPWGALIDLEAMAPMYPGQLAIVAARPGMGKTAFEISCALEQLKAGYKIGIISVEMNSRDLLRRFYAQVSGLTYGRIQGGLKGAKTEEDNAYQHAREYMRQFDGRLFLHGGEKCGMDRLKSISMDWVKNHGVQGLWLDYLTDFKLPKAKDYHLRVEAASQFMRDLSREDKLNIPVYLCAQLNRGGADGYPRINHLKGSSGLEQDAHVILLIDRPDNDPTCKRPYLNPRTGNVKDMENRAAIHVGKNRNGPTGIVFSHYHGKTMKFTNESEYEDVQF